MSLFEKYGGFSTVSAIVHAFYADLRDSPQVKHYFENINMEKLIDHQTKFISHALGGPAHYEGKTLLQAHRHLKVSADDFDEVADILKDNLEDAGMEDEDVHTVMAIVGSVRDAIVSI